MTYKIAIALGGGGVRGLANIGVLLALEEHDFAPHIIAGTSMGAIVGSIYADNTDAKQTRQIIEGFVGSEEFQKKSQRLNMSTDLDRDFWDKAFATAKKGYFYYRTLFRKSVISPETFFMEMDSLIPDKQFSELKLKFACVALDIVSGYPEILHTGPIRTAVKASSSVPGILPPVELGNSRYVDGGWAESVPVSAARFLGANFVIGVDVARETLPINYEEEMKNSMDILSRADDIARSIMNTYRTRDADFIIHPEVGSTSWSDFDNIDFYITSGYRTAKNAMPDLKKAIRKKKIMSFLWKKP